VSGFHLWSQTYDRNLRNILKVQTEVATSVAQQLKITLVSDEAKKIEAHDISPDAFTFYLQGRQAIRDANTKAEHDNAAELFRQSVAADPGFAEGWLYLEGALSNEVIGGLVKPEVVSAEMRHASDRVVSLEPGSSTAHRAVAQIYWSLDWNWLAATAEYKRAYELNPGDYVVVRQLADVTHAILGDDTTALSLYRRAIDQDPLNGYTYLQIGIFYRDIGKLPEAESAFRRSLALNPKGQAAALLCQTLAARGEATDALAVMQRVQDDGDRRWATALVYQALGRKTEADVALANAERLDAEDSAYSIAEIHAYAARLIKALPGWTARIVSATFH
jgi:tetratricopeptide (TPR) repeat protein